jgi:hypothetical protein
MTERRKQAKTRRIPDFASREEMAKWWDTHDAADYWDELKPVRVRVAKNLSEGITIRFDRETLEELRARAHKRGIAPTALARTWIIERLKEEKHHKRSA